MKLAMERRTNEIAEIGEFPLADDLVPSNVRLISFPLAMNVVFELFNNKLLIGDSAFDQIANRNYANQLFFV